MIPPFHSLLAYRRPLRPDMRYYAIADTMPPPARTYRQEKPAAGRASYRQPPPADI